MTTYRFWPLVRIGSIGDEISAQAHPYSYQFYLRQRLLNNTKVAFQFVGSTAGPAPIYHDAVAGLRIDQINANLEDNLNASHPDLLLIHAGTNDFLQDVTSTQALSKMQQLLTDLFLVQPKVRVILSKLIPLSLSGSGVTQGRINQLLAFNTGLTAMVTTNFPRHFISIVDPSIRFDTSTMLQNGIVPNQRGAIFIADAFLGLGYGFTDGFSRPD